jgi:DNA-binding NtrC family response regulator
MMSQPIDDMLVFLKHAAMMALRGGVDHYDFRRACARELRKAALEFEEGNKSAAAHRIKMSRNKIDYGLND